MVSQSDPGKVSITRVDFVPDRIELGISLDPIFFAASATQSFPNEKARAQFREKWLGRYLVSPSDHLYVAKDAGRNDHVAGYLVGCFDDPARDARFDDIGYFSVLKDLTVDYPAHLHINLDEAYRNRGLGPQLIDAFVSDVFERRVPGIHVVTGAASRSRPFYARNGFDKVHQFDWNNQPVVFLGRKLKTD